MKRQKTTTFEWTKEKEDQLKKLLASGLPQSKCAEKLDVPMGAVKARVQKLRKEGCMDILPSSEQGTYLFPLFGCCIHGANDGISYQGHGYSPWDGPGSSTYCLANCWKCVTTPIRTFSSAFNITFSSWNADSPAL